MKKELLLLLKSYGRYEKAGKLFSEANKKMSFFWKKQNHKSYAVYEAKAGDLREVEYDKSTDFFKLLKDFIIRHIEIK